MLQVLPCSDVIVHAFLHISRVVIIEENSRRKLQQNFQKILTLYPHKQRGSLASIRLEKSILGRSSRNPQK